MTNLRELTSWHVHAERYTVRQGGTSWTRTHSVKVPPLLVQLQMSVRPVVGGSSGGYESRAVGNLEAVDTLIHIDREASAWVRELGEDDPASTIGCVRRLGGLLGSMGRCDRARPRVDPGGGVCCTWHAVGRDVSRWTVQAKVATGWESPAWRPDNTCPVCGVRGKLRVRLLEQAAVCVECRATWDAGSIGLLADHIRGENHDEGGVFATRRLP